MMFDTNVLDRLLEVFCDFEEFSWDEYGYYITPVQVEELVKIPGSKKEKKYKIEAILEELGAEVLPSSSSPHSRIINSTGSNLDDAIIANTAVENGCILVTEDKDLYRRMEQEGLDVLTLRQFIEDRR